MKVFQFKWKQKSTISFKPAKKFLSWSASDKLEVSFILKIAYFCQSLNIFFPLNISINYLEVNKRLEDPAFKKMRK